MDRQQKIERTKNRSGRVSEVSNLQLTPNHIDSDYQSEHCDGVLSETGYLQVLKIVRKDGAGPSFVARWDQKAEQLDIDMHGGTNNAAKKFKGGNDGYSGHHTSRSSNPNTRIFDVTIKTPGAVVFVGTVSFSVIYQVMVTANSTVAESVNGTIIRADGTREEF